MIDLKASRLRPTYILLCLLSSIPVTLGQTPTRKPIVPVSPVDLLHLLPRTPRNWAITESSAKDSFVGWLSSQASREFRASSEPGASSPPAITRLKLMDTGYYPSFNGDFENFRVGKYPGAESLMIAGMRARKIIFGNNRERLRISVRGRFIVEVETENQPPNAGQTWLQLFDFKRISDIPDSGATELPRPINIQTIDELRPALNSTSTLFWGGPTPSPN